nr:kinesin-like protein KIN-14S [Ipomoea batatas]
MNDECSERKRLYNEMIELKGNIQVFCRCRPLNSEEVANGSTSVVDFDMSQENEIQIVSSDSSRKQFRFDHVFKPEDGQGKSFVDLSSERSSIMKYELFVSMLEVYNEKIRDLLVDNFSEPAKKLEVKQSAKRTQEVPGLIEASVYGTDEVCIIPFRGDAAEVLLPPSRSISMAKKRQRLERLSRGWGFSACS